MWVRGGRAHDNRKVFNKFIEIVRENFKNLITFQKFQEILCSDLVNNIRQIENCM